MGQFLDLQYRNDELARHHENRGRMAEVSITANTTGSGTIELPDVIDFAGAIYIEKPCFNYGHELDPDVVRDLLDLGPGDAVEFPQCSAHVTGWDTDENGHYNGAWVALVVTLPATVLIVDLPLPMTWHLSFTGVALKDVDPTG